MTNGSSCRLLTSVRPMPDELDNSVEVVNYVSTFSDPQVEDRSHIGTVKGFMVLIHVSFLLLPSPISA